MASAVVLTVALIALPIVAAIAARFKQPPPAPAIALMTTNSAGMPPARVPIERDERPVVEAALIKPERPATPEPSDDPRPTRSPGAVTGFVPPIIPDYDEMRRDYFRKKVQFTPGITDECTPQALLGVIYDIVEMYGTVRIHSTFRDPRRNARVGGVQSSLHLECRAIDFSVPGHPRALVDFLRGQPEVGGFSRYPFGHFHIDNGPRRQW